MWRSRNSRNRRKSQRWGGVGAAKIKVRAGGIEGGAGGIEGEAGGIEGGAGDVDE